MEERADDIRAVMDAGGSEVLISVDEAPWGMTHPALPGFDESKHAMVTVEFVSGTPAMTYWCSEMYLSPEVVRLDAELGGTVRPVVEIRRSGIGKLVIDFTAQPSDN